MILFLAVTLPRIGVTVWQVTTCVARPMIASGGMVALLWSLDMAWTPSGAVGALGLAGDAGVRSLLGAACYAAVLTASWFIVGRPDGAERHVLSTLGSVLRRVRGWASGPQPQTGAS
jgi:hypothetical protein